VEEEGGYLERGQVGLDQRAHLDELAEHEHRIAGTYDHLEQFVQRRQLAGPARDRPGLVQVLRRVVADLFEHRHQAQHQALALDADLVAMACRASRTSASYSDTCSVVRGTAGP